MADTDRKETLRSAARTRRRFPPIWVWTVVVVLGVAAAVLRGTEVVRDHAVVNLSTWGLAAAALLTLLGWFSFWSGFSRQARLIVPAACVAGIAAFFLLYRVERVTGELVPIFVFRFSEKADRRLEQVVVEPGAEETANVDVRTTTDHDFPQFLGPGRNCAVEGVELARDWTARPPQLLWKHEIGAGWSGFSVVNSHAVTMEQRDDLELVTCYNVLSGRLEWIYATPARYEALAGGVGPRATPTIDEGMVYALGATGHLVCLDGATGKSRWHRDLLAQYGITPKDENTSLPHGRSNSPLVAGDRVIVPIGGPRGGRMVSLAAFDKQTGELAWEGGSRQISYSSPAVATLAGVEQVLIVNEDTASGHDPNTGRLLWEHPWRAHSGGDPNVSQAVPIAPDRVFLSKGYGQGATFLQLVPQAGGIFSVNTLWQSVKVMRTKFTNITIRDRYAYGLSDGILECIELATGRRVWKDGHYGHGQLLRSGDLLLVLSEQGEVVLVEATPERPNHVFGRFQALEGMTWNTPALSGPLLLVRNPQEAACWRLAVNDISSTSPALARIVY